MYLLFVGDPGRTVVYKIMMQDLVCVGVMYDHV